MNQSTSIFAFLLAALFLVPGPESSGQGSQPVNTPPPPPQDESSNNVGSTLQFGVSGTGDLVANAASFGVFPGIVTCQGDSVEYGGGASFGYSAGLTASILPSGIPGLPKFGGMVTIGVRSHSGSFEAEEQIGQMLMPGDNLAPVISRYEIDASYMSVFVDPTLILRPSTSGLLLLGGPTLAFPINATYEQREVLAEPGDATFIDGSRERSVGSGDIESPGSVLLGLQLGVAWEVQLSPLVSIRPTLIGSLGLSNNAQEVDWKSHAVRLGVSLLFAPGISDSSPLQPN